MHSELEAQRVRHGVDKASDPILTRANQFAVFAADWVNAVRGELRSKEGCDFIGKELIAIDQAARFDFARRAFDADSTRRGFESGDFRIGDNVGVLVDGDAG
jgi:hypothetical protein